jgi:hypothetical protein
LYLDNSNEDEWIVRLSISPFAELNGATISYDFNNGKREYYITYEITSEVGIEADTIVHTIAERNIGSKVIYKNDNIQVSNICLFTVKMMLHALILNGILLIHQCIMIYSLKLMVQQSMT